MDFRQLQYLTAVAEYRNVTKAAESLYISQSALSHYIRKAEEELGVPGGQAWQRREKDNSGNI